MFISTFFCLSFAGFAQFYTGSNMTFGRKRVQYETFFWSYYRFEGFDVYFNRNGKNLALYTASFVQNNLSGIEQKVGETVADQLQFIIFNRLTDYKQSNIGYLEEENYNSGGITKILGKKVFLFFNGDYVDFERQIREGITEILVKQVLFGTSLVAQVKNNTTMAVPKWFEYGIISYLSRPWNTEYDDILRDAMLSRKYRYIAALEGEDAKMAGHSLFRYVAETYGESSIQHLLRVATVQKKINNAIKYALNLSYKELMREWQKYYLQNTQFEGDTEKIDPKKGLRRVKQKERKHYQFKLNPDGDHVAYISNEVGRARVHLRNLKTGKHKILMKIGYAINDHPDYTYPALAWHPGGEILAIAAEHKGLTSLFLYDVNTRTYTWLNLESLDKILSIQYAPNGRALAISAVQNGYSDIFHYNMGTKVLTPITKDIYDDAHPQFLKNGTQIIFSSNRLSDTLSRNERYANAPLLNPNHNLFIYDFNTKNTTLMRVTDDSLTHFSFPVEYENGTFAFLTDESGVNNRAIGVIDSVVASVDTAIHYRYTTDWRTVSNSERSIKEQDVSPITQELAELITYKNKDLLIRTEAEPSESLEAVVPTKTKFRMFESALRKKNIEEQRLADSLKAVDSLSTKGKPRLRQATNNDMVNELVEEVVQLSASSEQADTTMLSQDSVRSQLRQRFIQLLGLSKEISDTAKPTINPARRIYNVEYSINEATTQVGFSFLNSSYQAFTGGNSPIYLNPGATGFLKIGASDLMENHRLIAGYRLSFDFSNTEYLLSYENLEPRTGRQFVFHRQAIKETDPYYGFTYKQISHNGYFILKHPLTEVLLLKGTLIGRTDKLMVKAADDLSLREPDEWRIWGGLRGELVYDHTRPLGKNLHLGARSKVFFEYYQSMTEKKSSMFVVGADYRHYMRIWRTFIWANRVAGSNSFGQSKLIYYMGGVDDQLLPKFNQDIAVDQTQNYAYQTLATSMRGFTQNIRNGNTFVVLSSELRFPIISCLFSKPVNAQWLQNLQLVGFVDAGSAWVGYNPWNKDNLIYKKIIDLNGVVVTVQKDLSPFVAGVGFGLRTELFGYFLRIDRGNGIENGHFQKRVWNFAFGFDF